MGAGLAYQIRQAYPKVYTEYKRLCDIYGKSLLGTVQYLTVDSEIFGAKIVVNLFAQVGLGRDRQHTDYEALRQCFRDLRHVIENKGLTVAIPYGIGCGLGGVNWNTVISIVEQEMKDSIENCWLVMKT